MCVGTCRLYCLLDGSGGVGGEGSYCIPENMLEYSVGVGGGGSYCMPENSGLKDTGATGAGELCAIGVK